MRPQLVVFDLAGTTVRDRQDVPRLLQHAMTHFGFEIELSHAIQWMGVPKPVAIRELLNGKGVTDPPEYLVGEIHRYFVSTMCAFYENDPSVRENDGVSETLEILKANGVKVVVDTGFDRIITDALLQRMGWDNRGLLDGSVTSDEVERGRPHPDLLWEAMRLTGVRDSQLVAKVGDTPADLGEGAAAGCRWIIGITTGAFAADELAKSPHTHLIAAVPEVLDLFGILSPA